jgi:hypothetical protein
MQTDQQRRTAARSSHAYTTAMLIVLVVSFVVVLATAACGRTKGQFSSAQKLRDAIAHAGLGCSDYGNERTSGYAITGHCTLSGASVNLTVYTDLTTDVVLKIPAGQVCPPSSSWVQGRDKSWFVSPFSDAGVAAQVAKALGGDVRSC